MKTIENKVTTIEEKRNETTGGIDYLTYSGLMKTIMQQRKPDGFSVDDMRKDFRVIDALENVNGEISLEDADFEHFKTKMRTMKWGVAHKDLIAFEDDINAIK